MVQIVIRANPKEIASLVMALQGRRNEAGVQDVPTALRAVAEKVLQRAEGFGHACPLSTGFRVHHRALHRIKKLKTGKEKK